MDEIHAVLELFVSCRGSGWPLVRLEAEQQLLTQHLLMAAPMDKEEIEDLIKKCFEADNNGEINFLSFWSGMENLLELLGIREPSAHVDDKVYGLQVFRDGLLAEAMRKHQGPTSSVLLSRDEVLRIIDQTNKTVASRHSKEHEEGTRCDGGLYQGGDAGSSSLFWDEVYRETALLDSTSVLSITELSMMVFGFLKSYLRQESTIVRTSEADPHGADQPVKHEELERTVRPDTAGVRSAAPDTSCAPVAQTVAGSSVGATHENASSRELHSYVSDSPNKTRESIDGSYGSVTMHDRWHKGWELKHPREHSQDHVGTINDISSVASSTAGGHGRDSKAQTYPETSESTVADVSHILKDIDSEDPLSQLRHLLVFAGQVVECGVLSKKDMQQLRHLNAAAVDCVDRISVERDKRSEEVSEAVLSLKRMRTEKQQLIERLTSVEHQHSQLQLQHEQQLCERSEVDKLQVALTSERLERERLQALLHDKEEDLMGVTHEKDAIIEKLSSQNADLSRLLEAAHKEKAEMCEDHRRRTEALIREKEALEEMLRSSEEKAKAAEAARQQLQGDAHLSASTLRQRILELEQDKQRQEAEAEENEALILQLQGRLEEKVQQITILEVKSKQQARLLHQVRGVRDSLMQVLQESKEPEEGKGVSTSSAVAMAREPDIIKLKAGMKAALAHIRELESFIDEMRKEQRRGVHPRYEISAASGESSARSVLRKHIDEPCSKPLRVLPTLGDELEMSGAASVPDDDREVSGIGTDGKSNRANESASGEPDASSRWEGSIIVCKDSDGTARSAGSEASAEAQLSKQPSIREQIATIETQKSVSTKVGVTERSGLQRPHQAGAGTSGNVGSFASLRSELSTVDAVSKEPTSSASLPEAEDIFDPLDLLKSDDSVEAETQESSAVRGRLSFTSHAPKLHPADRSRQLSSKSGPFSVHLSSAASAVSPNTSEQLPSGGSSKISSSHSIGSCGLELALEARRCRSRATDSSPSNEQQDGIEASAVLPSQEGVSAFGDRGVSAAHDKSFLSDSLTPTASDGKFLMLTALSETRKSPTGSTSRRMEDRSQSSKVELSTKALDPSTLSSMFSMLGSCAALPGNAPNRTAASTDGDNDVRNTRSASGEDISKMKQRQPSRLSAAATAAISAKDVSEFRSLQRISQGSVHHVEQAVEGSGDHITTRKTSGSTQIAELTALEPTSDESPWAERDQWSPSKGPSPSPKAGHARARRTVSLGITETVEGIQGRDAVVQQRGPPSTAAPDSIEDGVQNIGGKGHHLHDSEVSRKASRALGTVPKGGARTDIEQKNVSESGSPTSSLRKEPGVLKSPLATVETCRSRGNANTQRTPRSRSSSAEPPSRKVPSYHATSISQQIHAPKKPHEGGNTEASGQQERSHVSSRMYEATECENRAHILKNQPPVVPDQACSQDTENFERAGLRMDCNSEGHGPDSQLFSTQRLRHELREERAKLQDEQTASAAALLAAAAGVVDASLQQQQHMIQRQQEHHEDLQRAQQRRIDMLQEQLEHLQKAKEEQRESGEQEQKRLIHSLEAKLEELQKRQDQREQDFQNAQRKLQEDLEVQLKKKLEELRCSPRRTGIQPASSCPVGQNSLHVSYTHRQDPDIRTSHTIRNGYQHTSCGDSNSFENIADEQSVHPPAQQDSIQQLVSDAHPLTAAAEDYSGSNTKGFNQFLSSSKLEDDNLKCTPWHRGGTEPVGCAGRMDIHNAGAEARGQPVADATGGYICEPHDRCNDSDDASSCASSSLMGSQCGLPVHTCSFEDMPTTTSSSFISQSTTPAVCSSIPSQRGNYLASEVPVERQIYSTGSDRLLQQSVDAQRGENVLRRHNVLRPQPSECAPSTPQHIPVDACQVDPPFSSCVVQRVNSSTGSLWSPKASRKHVPGTGERAPCCRVSGTSRPYADSTANCSAGGTTSSAGSKAGSQEKLLRGDFGYRSGSSHHRADQDLGPRESGTGFGRPQLSVYHPVSRAERVIPMQQAPIDSARFLGNSSINEPPHSLSGISRAQQGAFSTRDSQLAAPLASARSIGSTSSLAFPGQSSSLAQTSRLLQQSINPNQCTSSLTDFLGAASARSIPSQRHTDSRSSQTASTKRSRHSRCSESQVPPSPGRPREDSGVRSTRSSGINTRRESLIYGPRRTVNSLMSKQPHSTTSEINSARQRGKMHSCAVGADTARCCPRESISAERLEASAATPIMYRRASTSASLPDVELSRYPHHRQKTNRGSSRKDRMDGTRQPDETQNAEVSAAGESSSSAASSSGWAGFNGGFMSQVQKWIS